VATLRASLLGWSAKLRAQIAEGRIQKMLDKPGAKRISLLDRPVAGVNYLDRPATTTVAGWKRGTILL